MTGFFNTQRSQAGNLEAITREGDDLFHWHPMHRHIVAVLGEYKKISKAYRVSLSMPPVAQAQQTIPIRVEALARKDIEAIAVIIDGNADPVVIVSYLSENSDAYLSIRTKIDNSSVVRAIVKTAEGLEEISTILEVTH